MHRVTAPQFVEQRVGIGELTATEGPIIVRCDKILRQSRVFAHPTILLIAR